MKQAKNITNVTDIVWLQTAYLGDIILNTGCISFVKKNYPHIRQHLITTLLGGAALKDHSHLESIIIFDKKRKNILKEFFQVKNRLKEIGIDKRNTTLIQAHRSYRSTFLATYLGLDTITYRQTKLSSIAAKTVDRVAVFHEAVRYGILLEALGVERERLLEIVPHLDPIPLDDQVAWQKEIIGYKGTLVGIAPGSAWGTKRWPVDKFKNLAEKLLEKSNVNIVFLGGGKEVEFAKTIKKNLPRERYWDLTNKTSLCDLRKIYPRLSLLVCNDSSPIHYASSFDIPTLSIFGATTPNLGFGPLASKKIIIENKELECRPCSDHGPATCPLKHFNCMNQIGVDKVYKGCEKLL